MSWDALNWAWKQSIKPTAKFILVALADCNSDDNQCYPSITHLQKKTGYDRSTVIRSIGYLIEIGLISISGRYKKKNKYSLNFSQIVAESDQSESKEKPVLVAERHQSLVAQSHQLLVAESHQSQSATITSCRAPPSLVAERHLEPSINHKLTTNSRELSAKASRRLVPPCPYQEIVELYHSILTPPLSQVYKYDAFKSHISARWGEFMSDLDREDRTKENGLKLFRNYFMDVKGYDWLMGRVPPSPGRKQFKASLRWLVNSANFTKVINREYAA